MQSISTPDHSGTVTPTVSCPTVSVIVLGGGSGNVALDSTSFPDSTVLSYGGDNFDANGDGYLDAAEIASVTHIDVQGKGITSLEGIENFTALTYHDAGLKIISSA